MEVNLDLLVPAIFIGGSLCLGLGTFIFTKGRWARELEAIRATASLLGLEMTEGLEAIKKVYEEEGQGKYAASLEKLPKPLLRFIAMGAQWRLEGSREGLRVSIYPETRSSGKNSTTYTVVRAYFGSDLGYDLSVEREGALFKLGKALFGVQEVELDDAELDPRVKIKAQDPAAAKLLLGRYETRRALLELTEIAGDFRATREYAHWERRGVVTDAVELGAVLDALVRLAQAMRPS